MHGKIIVESLSNHMGARTVKWTSLDPCLVFSGDNLKLYIDFESYEDKNHGHLQNLLIYKAKQILTTKNTPRKVYMFYRR